MTRKHLSLSKALCAVLEEVGRQDCRSLSNLIEHGMREWISVEIAQERYRHLETGPIRPPGPYRANPAAIRQNLAPVPPPSPAGTKKRNQYTDGTWQKSAEGRKWADVGQKIRDHEADENKRKAQ
jgi:hypothetical protein